MCPIWTLAHTEREREFPLKVDPNNYDFIMYVDASGDDGFQFDKDSTICYAAAALLVKREDIEHNLDILKGIKKIVGCKETDEVKYSKVRRHRRSREAMELLSNTKGRMSCYVVFKKELAPHQIPAKGSKSLSVDCHLMSLRSLDSYNFGNNEKILIAIDRMKHTEEDPIARQMRSGIFSDAQHPERNFTSETIFRDSKDANFLLIQIADLLAGAIREHFEQYETNPDMLYFKGVCPKCEQLRQLKRGKSRGLCKHGRSRAANLLHSKNLHYIYHLIPEVNMFHMVRYFFVWPSKMMDQHFYLICGRN